jgi:hypothetical protein
VKRSIAVALAASFLAVPAASAAQSDLSLDALTLPSNRLGTECRLAPAATAKVAPGQPLSTGRWAGLPVSSNPWRGDDESTVAAIRARIDRPPTTPDPPGLSRVELARFRLQWARGIEEAYAAIYDTAGGDPVTVYALRFSDPRELERLRASPQRLGGLQFVGRTALVATGRPGDCFGLVADHLRELIKGLR